MTNQKLIDSIMSELGREVETFVKDMQPDTDMLDDAEGAARSFAKRCGGILFQAHVKSCLEAQDYGHVGDSVDLPDGTRAHFERYEKRWVLTHLGRFRFKRAYYWDQTGQASAIPLAVSVKVVVGRDGHLALLA